MWLFDLDNTLHDASHAAFRPLNASMTDYIVRHLGLAHADAEHLRAHYWQRYGATLLGLIRHHGIDPHHFLADTHQLPELEGLLRMNWSDLHALQRLPGRKLVLTNAPRDYALRVMHPLRLHPFFDELVAIEDMRVFGHWRPKPDVRMLNVVLKKRGLDPRQCVLVDDSPINLKKARRLGLRTVWMQGYAPPNRTLPHNGGKVGIHLHGRPHWACARITRLHTLHRWCASSCSSL